MDQFRALLTASYGRHYLAQRLLEDEYGNESPAGELIQVSTPAKQHIGAVGDRMLLEMTSADQARIIRIEPREN
ncbi:MAG TPA: ribosome small subunit-dependent GTPase A, partial [Polynucleobacter sp.]|nr:ribosome small subunit-dependent GTPase A [Polynucleobacter sp.]HQS61620.1 ribosome small subunit-dependent GTPase A [Polynucleobacter sp.]